MIFFIPCGLNRIRLNVELKVNLLYKMENEEIKSLRPLILVAEDDDSNFKLIKAIIGKKCDILWAKNGEEMLNYTVITEKKRGLF